MERTRWVLALIGIVLTCALAIPAVRNAQRLRGLSEHGIQTSAEVTNATASYTHYAYTVDGVSHTWNVNHDKAPFRTGDTISILILPEDASFSRPTLDRASIAEESKEAMRFAPKVAGVTLWFFLGFALVTHLQLVRARNEGEAAITGPDATRRRLFMIGIVGAPLLIGIMAGHFLESRTKDGSIVAPLLGAVVVGAVLAVQIYWLTRKGDLSIGERIKRQQKWIFPLLIAIAILRVIAMRFAQD